MEKYNNKIKNEYVERYVKEAIENLDLSANKKPLKISPNRFKYFNTTKSMTLNKTPRIINSFFFLLYFTFNAFLSSFSKPSFSTSYLLLYLSIPIPTK